MSQERSDKLESEFYHLADQLINELQADEHLSLELEGEQSQFVRFSQAKVRQAGLVNDGSLRLSLIHNQRTAFMTVPFTGDREVDSAAARQGLAELRQEVSQLPEDPYLVLPENQGSSREVYQGKLLPPEGAAEAILSAVAGTDFTGLYASGAMLRANANSAGQKHWFATESFFLDYSLITPSEKAVKATFAGQDWSQTQYQAQIETAKTQLTVLERPVKVIQPGRYRTYLAPAATAELVGMFSWGALSEASMRQGGSPLLKLQDNQNHLSPLFTLKENFRRGSVPRFNELGEIAPEELPLIVNGQLLNTLINARTAKEYHLNSNGANQEESLRSPEVEPGQLPSQEILSQLDTGLYLSNLHYLNWSDRSGGRITGMTRYACFWVEAGEIVAPIQDLRFDESLYAFFGDNLEAITDFQDLIPDVSTYDSRQLGGALMPGLLVGGFTFTL